MKTNYFYRFKHTLLYIVSLLIQSHFVSAQKSSDYKEVKIGNQIWMAENLNVDKFRNGEPIPLVKDKKEWETAGKNKQPACCYYDNDPANGAKYGRLYNWYAVSDPRGLAPEGWHVASDEEWTTLTNFVGPHAGTSMKNNKGWKGKGNGTNLAGFNGMPGGLRIITGQFHDFGYFSYWWTATEGISHDAWNRGLNFDDADVFRNYDYKENGFSVRCVKN